MRASSSPRIERLRRLLSELSLREVGHSDVIELLDCSMSSARNYIAELLNARVVVARACHRGSDRAMYRLNTDEAPLRAFCALLGGAPVPGGAHPPPPLDVVATHQAFLFESPRHWALVRGASMQRDPLVAALFGDPKTV